MAVTWTRQALAALVFLVLLTACDESTSRPSDQAPGVSRKADRALARPVIDQDFPDPDVVEVDGTYYAYATQRADNSRNVQLATSSDLTMWKVQDEDPLPRLPSWATKGRTWAPDVTKVADRLVMYFTAWDVDTNLQCIGVATGTSPRGPFRPVSDDPLVCPERAGGAIDPATYVAPNGTRYLLWKNDGNCCGRPTWLHLQQMSSDGLRTAGPATRLIREDRAWEGDLVEAPTLVRHGNAYVLFYSANSYAGDEYATGYAVADRLTGPYRKADHPFLTTDGTGVTGPGGQDVVTGADGRSYIVFHGWDPAVVYRGMYVLPLDWSDGRPVARARTQRSTR